MNRFIQKLPVQKLKANALLPVRSSQLAAGLDLFAAQQKVIQTKSRGLVGTGIATAIPQGFYGRIASRSGLTLQKGIDIGGGVIDSDYRGELGVIVFNLGEEAFQVTQGMRIAQLIIEKIEVPDVIEVQDLGSTSRGEAGYGSTGLDQQYKLGF